MKKNLKRKRLNTGQTVKHHQTLKVMIKFFYQVKIHVIQKRIMAGVKMAGPPMRCLMLIKSLALKHLLLMIYHNIPRIFVFFI